MLAHPASSIRIREAEPAIIRKTPNTRAQVEYGVKMGISQHILTELVIVLRPDCAREHS